jgi:hypothetical protein
MGMAIWSAYHRTARWHYGHCERGHGGMDDNNNFAGIHRGYGKMISAVPRNTN